MIERKNGLNFRTLRLDRRGAAPLYRQLYERIRQAILKGNLAPGTRLPSSRSLASQLATARGTVELAYAMLASEGYVEGRSAAGTVVAPTLDTRRPPSRGRRPAAPHRAGAAAEMSPPLLFQMGLPALDAFPRKLWSRLAARRARSLPGSAFFYQDAAGYRPLREAIVNYLAIARGLVCRSDQVFITAGYQGALALVTRVLLKPGDPVWFEDPGYYRGREALALAGASIVPVPVDAEGIDVEEGRRRAPWARLAVVTPTHQAPLGATLSLKRRLALLWWAASAGAWVVEDDYDSEFRYQGRPLPALKSLDEEARVFYVGTFSKVLLPGLRLGYLVVPAVEIDRFARAASLLMPAQALLDQMVVADFMIEGHFARHIKRMRQLYAERRAALAAALEARLGDRLRLELQRGGMHLIAWLDERMSDVALAERARAQGIVLHPLSAQLIEARYPPAVGLSFTNLPVESAPREVERLAALFDETG
jgi:GntR family transcriptional regulator/MocR family aminotransferase